MKKFLGLVLLLVLCYTEVNQAQLAKDSWSLGLGFRYPRFMSINANALNMNYGGYISLQRNFSEHTALRLKAGYMHLESEFLNAYGNYVTTQTNGIHGDLDLMFYLVPCESMSPYVFGGVGGIYSMLTDKQNATIDDNSLIMQFSVGGGLEWCLDEDFKLVTEFSYHTVANSDLDGIYGTGEWSGHDSYMGLNLGILYFLDKGEPSKYCQLYSGIAPEMKDLTNYNKIEEMIIKHIPKEVTKEVVVEKPAKATIAMDKWVLVGVNFDNNSAKITPESYPIIYDAAKTLLKNTDIKVEIQGYTDNIGSESYNKNLSQKRADVVKDYLVSKGVSASRLSAVGYGESNPVADNKTADGRALNRRIEFKTN